MKKFIISLIILINGVVLNAQDPEMRRGPRVPETMRPPNGPKSGWKESQPMPSQARIDERSRNWYNKRFYYREARTLYSDIRTQTKAIERQKNAFFTERGRIDGEVSEFYRELGFEEGVLETKLNELIAEMEALRKKDIELTESERALLRTLEAKKRSLEQLKVDFETVQKLDNALEEGMSRVFDQISKAQSYEQNAWKNYEAIIQTLSDAKAEQLYREIKTFQDNIGDIGRYLQGPLQSYFATSIEKLRTHMDQIKQGVSSLRAMGLELSEKVLEAQAEEAKKREAEKKANVKKNKEHKEGFFTKIGSFFSSIGTTVKSWFSRDTKKEKPEANLKHLSTPEKVPVKEPEVKQESSESLSSENRQNSVTAAEDLKRDLMR